MDRREFIALVGGAAAWPLGARAHQPTGKVARIGLLIPVSADSAAQNVAALRSGFRDLGYIDGQNIVFEHRYAAGRVDLLAGFAAELIRLNVDIIVTWGTPAALAAKQATTTIPIVMAAIADPTETGVVASLSQPGGNITGLTSSSLDTDAKRLELLKELVPNASRIGAFWNPSNPVSALMLNQSQIAAQAMHIELLAIGVQAVERLEDAFAAMEKTRPDALNVPNEVFFLNHKAQVLPFVARRRLPAMFGHREFVEAGGLAFYGPSWPAMFRRAAIYANKILKGAKPGDLPIEQPSSPIASQDRKSARSHCSTFTACSRRRVN